MPGESCEFHASQWTGFVRRRWEQQFLVPAQRRGSGLADLPICSDRRANSGIALIQGHTR